MRYTLTEELRKELYDTLNEVYEGCQGISGPRIPLEELLAIFKEPIPDQPLWKREPFTDTDRANMIDMMMDEIRDSVKTVAQETLDGIADICELISYADEDPQVTSELLGCLDTDHICFEDLTSGEWPHHAHAAAFMKRVGLVDEEGGVSDIGVKYLKEYKL
jgi:hypothetical protein